MVRTPCCDEGGLRKGTWTPEEDAKLKAYITRYGCWNWRQLPKYAGLARCGKSCRLRWMNYLRPNIKRGNYTKEEEDTIIRLHESLGNRWSAIAAQLPGRTDHEVKNHWHTTLKKRLKRNSSVRKDWKDNSQNPVFKRGTSKEKEETKLDNHHLLINPTSSPLILESSLSSPQPASSDQNSSVTTDNTFVSSKDSVSDNGDYTSKKALFEAYEANSGNFWTEPFFSDSFYTPSNDMLVPMMDTAGYEAEFPFLDGKNLCPFGFDQLEAFDF